MWYKTDNILFQPLSVRKYGFNATIQQLEELVTTEPTEKCSRPTGIPTHINLQSTMDKNLVYNTEFLNKLEIQSTIIQNAVKDAIRENDVASGTVTMPILSEKLENHHKSIIEFIKTNCTTLSDDCRIIVNVDDASDGGGIGNTGELLYVSEFQKGSKKHPMYCYSSHFGMFQRISCSKEIQQE